MASNPSGAEEIQEFSAALRKPERLRSRDGTDFQSLVTDTRKALTNPVDSLQSLLEQSPWINRLARALIQDAAEREDAIQDLWLAALKRPPRVGTERAWSRSVLKRRLADRLRRNERRPEVETCIEVSGGLDPVLVSATLESHARLGEAIKKLSARDRQLIVARYFHGNTAKDIARSLGIAEPTLRSQLSRALAALREDLKADDPDCPQAWVLALLPVATQGLKTGPITTITSSILASFKVMGVLMGYKSLSATAVLLLGFSAWFAADYMREESINLGGGKVEVDVAQPGLPSRSDRGSAAIETETRDSHPTELVAAPNSQRRFVLHVVDSQGRPAVAARVLYYRHETILVDSVTDLEGILRTAPQLGAVSCLVLAEGHALLQCEFQHQAEHQIVLPDGATMSGQVRVLGGLPYRPITLRIRQQNDRVGQIPELICRQIWDRDYFNGLSPVHVEADGSFLIKGLEPDKEVEIFVPSGFSYVLEDGRYWRNGKTFPKPAEGMLIEIMAMPILKARLIDGTTAEPLARRSCSLTVRGKNQRGEASLNRYTDEDGSITIDVGFVEFDDVKFMVEVGKERVLLHEGGFFRDTRDLGDIPVQIPSPWRFEVVDKTGKPIEGAVAAIEAFTESPATDSRGQSEFPEVSESFQKATVAAHGCRAKEVRILRDAANPQRIELEPSNRLEVQVEGLPRALTGLELLLLGGKDLMNPGIQSGLVNRFNRVSSLSLSEDEQTAILYLRPDADGVFRLQDVDPGVRFDIELRGEQDQFIAELKEQTMTASGTKSVTLRFDSNRVVLTQLTFVDESGDAIVDAEFSAIGLPASEYWSASTDDAGRFLYLRDKKSSTRGLRIEAEGYQSLDLANTEINPGSQRVVLKADDQDEDR